MLQAVWPAGSAVRGEAPYIVSAKPRHRTLSAPCGFDSQAGAPADSVFSVSAASPPLAGAAALAAVVAVAGAPRRRRGRSAPAAEGPGTSTELGAAGRLSQRLSDAERNLQIWSYAAEVQYTWLGLVSLCISGFSFYTHGKANPSMTVGIGAVVASVVCSAVGWWQARGCRQISRRCGLAAASLESEGSVTPSSQVLSMLPPLAMVEKKLARRERTAWLGSLFAVLGLHTMVGMLVAKVLTNSGTPYTPSLGVSLDVFTLLAASNCAFSHVLGAGIAALQRRSLPQTKETTDDGMAGWDR